MAKRKRGGKAAPQANLSQNLDKRRDLPAGLDKQAGQGSK